MSQHTMTIINQTFPTFRADLNLALQAITSQGIGATEPATKFAGQPWIDTTTDTLKVRNDLNNAWISLGQMDYTNGRWEPTTNIIHAVTTAGIQFKNSAGTNTILISDAGLVDGRDIDADGTLLDFHEGVIENSNRQILTTGVADAYLLAANVTVTTLARGEMWLVRPHVVNTGASTLKIDTTAVTGWKRRNASGGTADFRAGEIRAGQTHLVVFAGTNFITAAVYNNWASTSNAEAGTEVALLMDPKLTKEAMLAHQPELKQSRVVASSDTEIDFTLASGVDENIIHLNQVIPATNAVDFVLQASDDNKSTFENWTNGGPGTSVPALATPVGSAANEHGVSGRVVINQLSGNYAAVMVDLTYINATGSPVRVSDTWEIQTATALTDIRVKFSAGNIESGVLAHTSNTY